MTTAIFLDTDLVSSVLTYSKFYYRFGISCIMDLITSNTVATVFFFWASFSFFLNDNVLVLVAPDLLASGTQKSCLLLCFVYICFVNHSLSTFLHHFVFLFFSWLFSLCCCHLHFRLIDTMKIKHLGIFK